MVKAKFGALALTVLMGLGAVSPLHGVTEAHALNAPVANSAQQKTVVSTTDDSDGVMSYKESGKTFVSEDNGASWVSEEDYNNSHPAINYEWWTYDEYKEWLEQEKVNTMIDTKCVEITDQGAIIEDADGNKTLLEADTVIIAVGTKSLVEERDKFIDTAFDVINVGDCVKASSIVHAVHTGFDAGWTL